MENTAFVEQRVREYYWIEELSCTTATLRILSEIYDVELSQQVLDSVLGMHGAGKYGAQCGLVEGALLFIGIFGRARRILDGRIVAACHQFAQAFEERFGSLSCRELRPQGFSPELPPHLCADLTCRSVGFAADFVQKML